MTAPTTPRPAPRPPDDPMAAASRAPGGAREQPRAGGSLVLVGLTLFVVGLLTAVRPLRDPDAWGGLRTGQWLAAHGRWVTPDPFSTLATHDLVLTGWLGDLAAAGAHAVLGPAGLVVLRVLCVVALAVLLLRSARREADPVPATLATGLGLVATLGVGYEPVAGSMVLGAACVGLWRRSARDGGLPWAVVPLTWLWAGVDATWVLGPLVGLVTVVGLRTSPRRALRLLAIVAACVGAAAVTPVGPRLLTQVWSDPSLTGARLGRGALVELTSPVVVVLVGAAALVLARWLRVGPPSRWEVAHVALAVALGVTWAATAPVAACLLTPVLAGSLQGLRSRPAEGVGRGERTTLALVAGTVLLAGAALGGPAAAVGAHLDPLTPLEPALRAIPAGTVLLDDVDVSGRLLFTQPRLRLVVDSRLQLYDASYLRRYVGALDARPGWREFVATTGAGAAVLPVEAPLAAALGERLGWRTVAAAEGYVVLVAPSPEVRGRP